MLKSVRSIVSWWFHYLYNECDVNKDKASEAATAMGAYIQNTLCSGSTIVVIDIGQTVPGIIEEVYAIAGLECKDLYLPKYTRFRVTISKSRVERYSPSRNKKKRKSTTKMLYNDDINKLIEYSPWRIPSLYPTSIHVI